MTALAVEQPRDFLTMCVASSKGNPILEQIRDKGAEAMLAIYRLVKNAMVHALDNQAMLNTAAQTQQVIADFASTVGTNVSVTFLGDTVFVCGQLLRASRAVYESAAELEEILGRCGVSEVMMDGEVTEEDLLAFAAHLMVSLREPDKRDQLLSAKINHIGVRKVEAELEKRSDEDDLPVEEKVIRLYATALVVMRGFYDSIAQGATLLPHRVKRLSQRLVSVAETENPAILGMLALGNIQRDDASRSVLAAILAVVTGRQITRERVPLARLAMAALMTDVGRVRLAGPEGRDRLVALPESLEASVPPATSGICISTGGVNIPNALRTVVTNEATWLEREGLIGAPYGGQITPLVESQILRLVRALVDYMAPRDATIPARSPLDAMTAVAAIPNIDPVLLRLLVNAIGLIPIGSVVEFESGEWGVVVGPSETPDATDKPTVRLVTDRKGRPLTPPREVDLGTPSEGRIFPRIANVISPGQARFNVAGVFLSSPALPGRGGAGARSPGPSGR